METIGTHIGWGRGGVVVVVVVVVVVISMEAIGTRPQVKCSLIGG